MSRLQLAASALALALAAAVAQPSALRAQQASTTGGPAALVPADLEFVLKAADGGLAEVALGKLAQEKAAAPEVKQFAQRMVEDHGKANEALAKLATERGTKPPQQPSEAAQAVEKTMSAYAGKEFDEVYIAQQVGDHVVAVALFEHAAEHAKTPELRDFAKKALPTLQEHLKEAQALMQKAASGG
jgi:putative membrane protein